MGKKEQLIDFTFNIYTKAFDKVAIVAEDFLEKPVRQDIENMFKDASERSAHLFLKAFNNPVGRTFLKIRLSIKILNESRKAFNDLRKFAKGFRKLAKEIKRKS